MSSPRQIPTNPFDAQPVAAPADRDAAPADRDIERAQTPVVAQESTLSKVAQALDPRKYLAAYGVGIGVNAVATFVPQVRAGLDVVKAVSPLLEEGITQVVSGSILGRSVLPSQLEAPVSKVSKAIDALGASVAMTYATTAALTALAGPAGWATWLVAAGAQAVVNPLVAQGLDHSVGRGLDFVAPKAGSLLKAGFFGAVNCAKRAGHAVADKLRHAPEGETDSLLHRGRQF